MMRMGRGEGWDSLEKLGKERNEERRSFVFFFCGMGKCVFCIDG